MIYTVRINQYQPNGCTSHSRLDFNSFKDMMVYLHEYNKTVPGTWNEASMLRNGVVTISKRSTNSSVAIKITAGGDLVRLTRQITRLFNVGATK
jgi:hypothetical protein